MEIVVKNNNWVHFDAVPCGTVIRIDYEGSLPIYAIKVDNLHDMNHNEKINCIDLHDGSWFYVESYEQVTILYTAKLVIE